jgi:hypothetical protein
MKNTTINLALWWLYTFDRSQFLYKSLGTLNLYIRWFFYIAITFSLWQFIELVASYINLGNYSIPLFIQNILYVIGKLIKIFMILFMIGLSSYEALYSSNFDVDKYLNEYKNKQDFIKFNKLQKWRLRNMKLWLRIILYLGFWAFLYLWIESILINAFFTVYGNNPSKEIYIQFLIDYDLTIKYFTVIYLLSIAILDYFVRKNRNKKFPQETK